jgi:arsenate reductase
MHYKENEITLLYNKQRELDRKTLATAHVVSSKINRQEIHTVRVSETLFYILVEKLGGDPKSIIDKSQPFYQRELRGKELSNYGWYMMIMNHPKLLKAPIAMYHGKAILCTSSNDVLKLN